MTAQALQEGRWCQFSGPKCVNGWPENKMKVLVKHTVLYVLQSIDGEERDTKS